MKIIVIGGGITGLCVSLDLTLRGFEVILIEKEIVGVGTTKCAYMLHSGARYLVRNIKIAKLCFKENSIWRRMIPFAIDISRKGIFVVLDKYDKEYVKVFNERKDKFDIETIYRQECFSEVPNLSDSVQWGYKTYDFVLNNSLVVQAFKKELLNRGVTIYENTEIASANFKNNTWKILLTNKNNYIKANGIINAAGYGISSAILSLGGKPIFHLKYIHGSMALFNKKLSNQIISVCGDNFVGDVIIPFNQYTLIGSTWHEIPHCKRIFISPNDKNEIYTNTIKILPEIKNTKLISFISGIRVHYEKRSQFKKIRSGPDGFNIIDHRDLPNIVTILPGKFVLARIAAKHAVDILLRKIIKGRIPMSQTHEFMFQSRS